MSASGKRCGHTRYTLHLGELRLDTKYFSQKCTYHGCEPRMAACPKFLESLSAELRQTKVAHKVKDEDFATLIQVASKRITSEIKQRCPNWATSVIAYDASFEREMANIARREKAFATEMLAAKDLPSYIGSEQLPLFAERNHSVYLKTTDCHWQDAASGLHWFKFGHSKDPQKRYAGEQVTLNQDSTFGLILPIHSGQGRLFEKAMQGLIAQRNIATPEGPDAQRRREKFYTERSVAVDLFNTAYKEFAV